MDLPDDEEQVDWEKEAKDGAGDWGGERSRELVVAVVRGKSSDSGDAEYKWSENDWSEGGLGE